MVSCSPFDIKWSIGLCAPAYTLFPMKSGRNILTTKSFRVKNTDLYILLKKELKDTDMSSNTTQTRTKRKNKLKKAGSKRKNMLKNKGTTPKFEIHVEKK